MRSPAKACCDALGGIYEGSTIDTANHHDSGYKELFSHPEFVQQLMEGFAPPQISQLMDFSTLRNHSGHYITPLFEERVEDVVWSVEITWNGLREWVYQPHLRYYLVDEGRYTDEELGLRQSPLSGVFGVENAGDSWEALQRAVDRIVAIIRSDPNKARTDRVVTRWIKRHLHRLGADIHLEQLNSLVEDKDMLAENLENLVKKERLEGRQEGRLEGRHEGFAGLLRAQLALKFGELPPWVDDKLAAASDEQLGIWGTRLLSAESLDEVFEE